MQRERCVLCEPVEHFIQAERRRESLCSAQQCCHLPLAAAQAAHHIGGQDDTGGRRNREQSDLRRDVDRIQIQVGRNRRNHIVVREHTLVLQHGDRHQCSQPDGQVEVLRRGRQQDRDQQHVDAEQRDGRAGGAAGQLEEDRKCQPVESHLEHDEAPQGAGRGAIGVGARAADQQREQCVVGQDGRADPVQRRSWQRQA